MDRERITVTYIYPNRRNYWENRRRMSQGHSNISSLRRKIAFAVHGYQEKRGLFAEDIEEFLKETNSEELKTIFQNCLDQLPNCPKCDSNDWHKELMMKSCKQCDYVFGFDDSFSYEDFIKRLNDLDISLTAIESLKDSNDFKTDIKDSCQLHCPCGNQQLHNFFTSGSEEDLITCEKCGDVVQPDNDCDMQLCERKKTLITSLDMLRPGDHILWCHTKIYEHHAIFIRKVDENIMEVFQLSKGTIRRIERDTRPLFNKPNDPVYRIEYNDPANWDLVLKRAKEQCENSTKVSKLASRNCEHFATYCQTGHWAVVSGQVKRVSQVIEEVFGKSRVKLAQESAQSLRLIAMLALSTSKRAARATKLQQFLCSVVGLKVGKLGSNIITFAIIVFIEVGYLIYDVIAEKKKTNSNLKSFITWRLGEFACRIEASGIFALLSYFVSGKLVNSAIIVMWPYVFCLGSGILPVILFSLATCLWQKFKGWKDKDFMIEAARA